MMEGKVGRGEQKAQQVRTEEVRLRMGWEDREAMTGEMKAGEGVVEEWS